VLILLQVLVLDNIYLGGYVNPYLYIYFILLLPFETPGWLLLILAFFLGLGVDIFSDSIGIHAASTVLMAFFRPLTLKMLFSKREYEPGISPSIRDLGFRWFFSYALIMVTVHHLFLFYLEVFRLSDFFITFQRVILSIVFTLFLILISQYLFHARNSG